VFPLSILLTADTCGKFSVDARELGVDLDRVESRIQVRIGVIALSLALAPTLWMTAVGYMAQAEALLGAGGTGGEARAFLVSAGAFAMVVALWAPISSLALSRAVSAPIESLTKAAKEIVEEGNQTSMGAIATTRRDEVGMLAERFNDLLEMMRDLSAGAQAIAYGKLDIQITRRGELPDAFQKMAESLTGVVTQIRQTSVELGCASALCACYTRDQRGKYDHRARALGGADAAAEERMARRRACRRRDHVALLHSQVRLELLESDRERCACSDQRHPTRQWAWLVAK
jgi:HAMP domain-containing protein